MDIRSATAADVPAVLPMVEKICALHEAWDAAKYGFLPNTAERYRRWLTGRATDLRSVFLVAERQDQLEVRTQVRAENHAEVHPEKHLVAFLIGTIESEIPIYRLSEFGFIHDLWVEESYRHEGIGRQMVMLAVERFKQMGVKQIRLDTAAANESARALFKSCGFRLSTMEMLLEQ
jgi:ribosomal protein S18 acetylase RimI-like enzyme